MSNPFQKLSTLGVPVAYRVFNTPVNPPYLIYYGTGADTFPADDRVYHKEYRYTVEYYFKEKNEEFEDRLERFFDEKDLFWSRSDDVYIPSENMNVIYYDI